LAKWDSRHDEQCSFTDRTGPDCGLQDATAYLAQPEASALNFIAVAVGTDDEGNLTVVGDVINRAKELGIKVILIAEDVSPIALHQLLKLGADDFVPYPLPEGALHDSIERINTPEPQPVADIAPATHAAPVATGQVWMTTPSKPRCRPSTTSCKS